MASNAIHEMISAYASGCMDKKNLKTFRDYIDQGGDMPVGELGELQNVVALLPIILELEKPSPALKDKVAKKLISLQEEIKERIKTTKQTTRSTAKTIIDSTTREEDSDELNLTPTHSTRFETIPPPTKSTQPGPRTHGTEYYESAKLVNPPPPTKTYDLPPRTLKDLENDEIARSNSIKFLWTGIGFLFLLLIAGLILVYSSVTDYGPKITALEQRINSLQEEVISTREFVNRYDDLIEFMTYKDIQIFSLSPVEEGTPGSGKLLISFIHREGLLQLSDMPTLGTNQAFQVWLISEGRSYSLGTFVPNRTQKYISIPDIPYLPKNQIDLVRVTIEPLTGSELPQGPAVLFGSVGNATTGR